MAEFTQDLQTTEELLNGLATIIQTDIPAYKDEITREVSALKELNGYDKVSSGIELNVLINNAFDRLAELTSNAMNKTGYLSDEILEYSKGDPNSGLDPLRLAATGGMLLLGAGEGFLSGIEDVSDAGFTLVGGVGGLALDIAGALGAPVNGDGWRKFFSDYVATDNARNIMNPLYDVVGKYSYLSADSGAMNLCRAGGKIAFYVTAGGYLASTSKVGAATEAINKIPLLSKIPLIQNVSAQTVAATLLTSTAGFGEEAESSFQDGKGYMETIRNASVRGAKDGAISFGIGAVLDSVIPLLTGAKGAKEAVNAMNKADSITAKAKLVQQAADKADETASAATVAKQAADKADETAAAANAVKQAADKADETAAAANAAKQAADKADETAAAANAVKQAADKADETAAAAKQATTAGQDTGKAATVAQQAADKADETAAATKAAQQAADKADEANAATKAAQQAADKADETNAATKAAQQAADKADEANAATKAAQQAADKVDETNAATKAAQQVADKADETNAATKAAQQVADKADETKAATKAAQQATDKADEANAATKAAQQVADKADETNAATKAAQQVADKADETNAATKAAQQAADKAASNTDDFINADFNGQASAKQAASIKEAASGTSEGPSLIETGNIEGSSVSKVKLAPEFDNYLGGKGATKLQTDLLPGFTESGDDVIGKVASNAEGPSLIETGNIEGSSVSKVKLAPEFDNYLGGKGATKLQTDLLPGFTESGDDVIGKVASNAEGPSLIETGNIEGSSVSKVKLAPEFDNYLGGKGATKLQTDLLPGFTESGDDVIGKVASNAEGPSLIETGNIEGSSVSKVKLAPEFDNYLGGKGATKLQTDLLPGFTESGDDVIGKVASNAEGPSLIETGNIEGSSVSKVKLAPEFDNYLGGKGATKLQTDLIDELPRSDKGILEKVSESLKTNADDESKEIAKMIDEQITSGAPNAGNMAKEVADKADETAAATKAAQQAADKADEANAATKAAQQAADKADEANAATKAAQQVADKADETNAATKAAQQAADKADEANTATKAAQQAADKADETKAATKAAQQAADKADEANAATKAAQQAADKADETNAATKAAQQAADKADETNAATKAAQQVADKADETNAATKAAQQVADKADETNAATKAAQQAADKADDAARSGNKITDTLKKTGTFVKNTVKGAVREPGYVATALDNLDGGSSGNPFGEQPGQQTQTDPGINAEQTPETDLSNGDEYNATQVPDTGGGGGDYGSPGSPSYSDYESLAAAPKAAESAVLANAKVTDPTTLDNSLEKVQPVDTTQQAIAPTQEASNVVQTPTSAASQQDNITKLASADVNPATSQNVVYEPSGNTPNYSGYSYNGEEFETPEMAEDILNETEIEPETDFTDTLTASIDDVIKDDYYSTIPTSSVPVPRQAVSAEDTKAGKIISASAGIAAAAAAGLGTNYLLNRPDDNDDGDDEELTVEDWKGEPKDINLIEEESDKKEDDHINFKELIES